MKRCDWALASQLEADYHDREWGVPSFDDRHLFEMLTLEGAQSGLSWSTILNKREGYRRAFAGFDPAMVARYSIEEIDELCTDQGIVRHRGKIESTIANAKAVIAVQEKSGTLADYLWQFVEGRTIRNRRRRLSDVPTETRESQAMSRQLKRDGFRFIGPTTCYAFMQAVGMVNDHLVDCFRYQELGN